MMQYHFIEGAVIDNNDPLQLGRVKAWCPTLDGENYDVALIPWANYVTPLAGQTRDYPGGSGGNPTPGYASYGFWAIPKVGAQVVICLMYGDPTQRYYLGSIYGQGGNRSLPSGRSRPDLAPGPISDTLDPMEPQTSFLNKQFGGNLSASEAQTRGAYERSVAQGVDSKDGTEGYAPGVVDTAHFDPQTYCLTTPGRHTLVFQDNPKNSRTRLKTADGHQIIFDDANERIYISTATGKTWIELDSDGHIHMFAADSISVSSGGDINFTAVKNFNVKAGKDINLAAGGHGRMSACDDISLSGKGVNIDSSMDANFLAVGVIKVTGATVTLNGPPATPAPCADSPSIKPDHEPWTRPAGSGSRNSNWKK